ncbi:UNVERIFIED_ORG: CHAT domain-containing protein [Rhizobium etli]
MGGFSARILKKKASLTSEYNACIDGNYSEDDAFEAYWARWLDISVVNNLSFVRFDFIPALVSNYCSFRAGDKDAAGKLAPHLRRLISQEDDIDRILPRLLLVLWGIIIDGHQGGDYRVDAKTLDYSTRIIRLTFELGRSLGEEPKVEKLASESYFLTPAEANALMPGTINYYLGIYFLASISETSFGLRSGEEDRVEMARLKSILARAAGLSAELRKDVIYSPLALGGYKPNPSTISERIPEFGLAIKACKQLQRYENLALPEDTSSRIRDTCYNLAIGWNFDIGSFMDVLSTSSRLMASGGRIDSPLDNWRIGWSRARAFLRLGQGARSLEEFSKAATFLDEIPQKFADVLPDAHRWGALFPNAIVRMGTQTRDENIQAFFDEWHSASVHLSIEVVDTMNITDSSRRFDAMFPEQEVSFPREQELLGDIEVSDASIQSYYRAYWAASPALPLNSDRCDAPFISLFFSDFDQTLYIYYCNKSKRLARSSKKVLSHFTELLTSTSERPYEMLYDIAIRPVAGDMLEDGDVLTIVPHSFFWGTNFAALGDGSSQLIDRYAIRLASFANAAVTTRRGVPIAVNSLLVVFNPVEHDDHVWSVLPGASNTASVISERLKSNARVSILEGPSASESSVLSMMGEFDVVHFATHAFASATRPFASSVVLSPDAETSDGYLSLGEIAGIEKHPKLIYLASCESGKGVRAGGGPMSLASLLSRRGRIPVIATTSNLSDQASQWIESVFYKELAVTGDPATSLRKAQLIARKFAPDPNFWAPVFYWGP